METGTIKFHTPEEIYEELLQLRGEVFAIDTETTGLEWFQNELIGVSVYCPAKFINTYYFCCQYGLYPGTKAKKVRVWDGGYTISPKTGRKLKTYRSEEQFPEVFRAVGSKEHLEAVQAALGVIVKDERSCLIFHNFKFDAHFLGLDLRYQPCQVLDTSIMVHLFDSRLPKSLEKAEQIFLAKKSKRQLVTTAPKGKKQWEWPPEIIYDYAKNDALVTYQLAETLIPKLRKLGLISLLKLQMEYLKVLKDIEAGGMQLNLEFCKTVQPLFDSTTKAMEQELFDTTGQTFNWRSTPQLSRAIYEGMGISKPVNPFADADGVDRSRMAHKGRYNKWCTSAFLLMEKANHPLGNLILDLREVSILKKAVEKYPILADEKGIIHTNFNLSRTRTGRLSSSNPNLQNIASEHRVRETQSVYSGGAIRQNEYNLRQAFRAREGYTICSIDMAQQEMRLFAILAEEPIMMQALRDRKDIHLMIAIAVWGDCGKERNKLHREWSKTIAFG